MKSLSNNKLTDLIARIFSLLRDITVKSLASIRLRTYSSRGLVVIVDIALQLPILAYLLAISIIIFSGPIISFPISILARRLSIIYNSR